LSLAAVHLPAAAAEPKPPPDNVSGVQQPEVRSSDGLRSAGNAALFVPRWVAGMLFVTTGAAAGIVEDEQIVPRVRDLLFSRDGRIGVFPTLFVETGLSPNIGARMIATADNAATTLRAGYGGADTNVVESRMRFARATPFPMVLSLEGMHDRRTHLGYMGIGQDPATDLRNRRIGAFSQAVYRQRRERVIGSMGVRFTPDTELFLSSSFSQRDIDSVPGGAEPGFDDVFAPGSVPGALRTTRLVYSELAFRLDTRATRAAPSPGLLLEGYAGSSEGLVQEEGRFGRIGGRAAGFFSLYRRTNVLSPRLVLDGVSQRSDTAVPFTELARQPDFRGFNTRRDFTSLVVSLDYRWKIANSIAGHMFVDGATVAPSVRDLRWKGMRYATGFGAHLYSDNAHLARIGLVVSPEGVLFQLSFGVAGGFGDRQHRD
jgi:hypothetical protein